MKDLKVIINEKLKDNQVNSKINKFVKELNEFLEECEESGTNSTWVLGKIFIKLGKKDWDVDGAMEYYENQ